MRTQLLVMTVAVVLYSTFAEAAKPGALKAGAATSNITPPLGTPIIGNFKEPPAAHVHDELQARCLVLENGETRLALVVCDLLGMHRSVSDEARQQIQQHTGIPRENVLISATHTHSAGSALGDRYYDPGQPLNAYQKFVAQRIADGVRRAANLLRPAELAFGTVEAPEHVFNRRWYMRAGTMPVNPFGNNADLVKMNPPVGSPNITEPAGPTDPTVSFISVRDHDGKPISLYTAYSLHYIGDVGPAHISADYFAMYCDEMTRLLGADRLEIPFVAMLANGTSGDINNINFRMARAPVPTYGRMRAVSHDVAAKVFKAMSELKYERDVILGARYTDLVLKSRRPTEEQLKWAVKTLENAPADFNARDISQIYADRAKQLHEAPETVPLPLQVLRVGPVAIGSMPAEVFCEIGLEFKDRSAIKPAFLVSIAHGYFGYLPTPRQIDLGGYETWLGTNRLEKEASVKMLDTLVGMTKELADDK